MQITFSVDLNSKTLNVQLSGEFDFLKFREIIDFIMQKCIDEDVSLVFLDALSVQDGNIPSHERFFIGVEIAKKWRYNLKAAIVYPEKWINKLGETVANNRGANILVTNDRSEAKEWLYSLEG